MNLPAPTRRCFRLARPGTTLAFAAAVAALGSLPAQGGTLYFDATAGAGNGVGGTGTLAAQTTTLYSTTTTGDATLVAAATTDDGVFQGTAGAVTLGAAYALNSATFNVTGYTLMTSGTTTETLTTAQPISLAANVNLGIDDPAATANRTLAIGSVIGGAGAGLTIQGAQATATTVARLNIAAAGSTINVPITINLTGAGVGGIVATSTGAVLGTAATITNNSAAITNLGATSGNDLTVNGVVSGSAGLLFAAGASGGAGVITLNAVNTYGGATEFNGTASTGFVKLGVDNAISVASAVVMGFTTGAGQNLDLNGHNQTVASLASNGGTGSIVDNGTGAGTDTLTINGSATTNFGLVIAAGASRTVALTLAAGNTGTLGLSGANTYTGATTISGGKLRLTNATGTSATGTGLVTLNGGPATTLSGTGFSTGMLTVTAGSRLAPGVNTGGTNGNFGGVGTLTVGSTGGTTLTNANLDFDLANTAATAGGTTNDLLTTGGTLALGTIGVTVNELNGALLTGTPYTLISGATSVTGAPNFTTTYVGGTSYTANYSVNGSNNLQVTFTAVPEPSTWAAMLLGVGLLGVARQRRRLVK